MLELKKNKKKEKEKENKIYYVQTAKVVNSKDFSC